MRNFGANIRPAAIIDEATGRRHWTPGFQHRRRQYQTRFVIVPDLSPAPFAITRGTGWRGLFARAMANLADAGAGGFGRFRRVGRASVFPVRDSRAVLYASG
jgi:hypothetical protein